MINRTKPYRLTAAQKEAIALHLAGVLPRSELATKLGLAKPQYVSQAIYALVRHMVRTKKLDITQLLNDY